eukprot:GHVS01028207.1.p1 GENE.GHVS01028207.1~~GHVS01028207.1.p1  ORF type:complete len:380 (-),score=38.52 GHVS01028207.1:284-1423(-)
MLIIFGPSAAVALLAFLSIIKECVAPKGADYIISLFRGPDELGRGPDEHLSGLVRNSMRKPTLEYKGNKLKFAFDQGRGLVLWNRLETTVYISATNSADVAKISNYEFVLQGTRPNAWAYLHLKEKDNAFAVAGEVTIDYTFNEFRQYMHEQFDVRKKKMIDWNPFQSCIETLKKDAEKAMADSTFEAWKPIFKDDTLLTELLRKTSGRVLTLGGTNYQLYGEVRSINVAPTTYLKVFRWTDADNVALLKYGTVLLKSVGVTIIGKAFVLVGKSIYYGRGSLEFMHFGEKDGAFEVIAAHKHELPERAVENVTVFLTKCITPGEKQFTEDAVAAVEGGVVHFAEWVKRAIMIMDQMSDTLVGGPAANQATRPIYHVPPP